MNIEGMYNDTSTFLKWDKTDDGKAPFVIQILADPKVEEYKGKPKYEFRVNLAGSDGEKTLSCSQAALNALIESANAADVQDKIDEVVWKCWKEGEGYETAYFWQVAEGAPF